MRAKEEYRDRRGELQSRSLTWGVRASCLSGNFGILQTPGPTFFNRRRRRRGVPTLRPAVPPFCDPYVPPSGRVASPATDR